MDKITPAYRQAGEIITCLPQAGKIFKNKELMHSIRMDNN